MEGRPPNSHSWLRHCTLRTRWFIERCLLRPHRLRRQSKKIRPIATDTAWSAYLSLHLSVPVPFLIFSVVASRPSNPLNPSLLASQTRLLLTTLRVYKVNAAQWPAAHMVQNSLETYSLQLGLSARSATHYFKTASCPYHRNIPRP